MILPLAILLLFASPVSAEIVFMSGFDCLDEDSTSYDCLEFIEGHDADGDDADMVLQTSVFHGDDDGGDSSSKAAVLLNIATGERTYYQAPDTTWGMCEDTGDAEPLCDDDADCTPDCRIADSSPFPLAADDIAVQVAWNFETPPTSSRDIFEMLEGTNPDVVGCGYRFDSNRYVTVQYNDTDLGTFSVAQERYSCDGYHNLSCLVDDDCPGLCTADGTPTEVLHWSALSLRQQVDTVLNNVVCSLYINGIKRYTSGIYDGGGQTPTTVKTFRFGGINDEADSIKAYIDDIVVWEDEAPEYGYVGTLYPTSSSTITGENEWEDNGCPDTDRDECLDELGLGLEVDRKYIYKAGKNKTQRMDDFTSDVGTLGTNIVTALEAVVIGTTGTGSGTPIGAYTLEVDTIQKSSGEITSVVYSSVRPVQYARIIADDLLESGDDLSGIEWVARTGATSSKAPRVDAVVVYAFVKKPSLPLADFISWGNMGADDAYDTCLVVGDSTSVNTGGATCPDDGGASAGDLCVNKFYCSWDSAERDKHGGCTLNDFSPCNTCLNDRTGVNGGAGWPCGYDTLEIEDTWEWCEPVCDAASDNSFTPCTDDTDCPPNPGGSCLVPTCTAGVCNNIEKKTCTVSSDCEGLGECVDDATCIESCPGSECPAGLSWVDQLIGQLKCDNLINCGVGAQTTPGADADFEDYLDGTYVGPDCEVLIGSFEPPDTVFVLLGTNDFLGGYGSPNCEGVGAGSASSLPGSGKICDVGSQVDCLSDADCTGDSVCIGRRAAASGTAGTCLTGAPDQTGGLAGVCSVWRRRCGSNDDCPSPWGDCSVSGESELNELYQRGACKCVPKTCNGGTRDGLVCRVASDCSGGVCEGGSCGSGYTCIKTCAGGTKADQGCFENADCPGSTCTASEICHRDCTFDIQCYGSGGCNDTTNVDVCEGTCTRLSSSIPCTVDADCEADIENPTGGTATITGKCNVGDFCECTGTPTCERESDCRDQYLQWVGLRTGHQMALDYFESWQELAEGDTTGSAPRIFFLTVPDTPDHMCQGQRGDKQYIQRTNQHLRDDHRCVGGDIAGADCAVDSDCTGGGTCERRFRYVIDFAAAIGAYDQSLMIADDVHFSVRGNEVGGVRVVDYAASFNACAINVGTPQQTVQRYCREADNLFTNDLCTEAADCGDTETCQVKPCDGDDADTQTGCADGTSPTLVVTCTEV